MPRNRALRAGRASLGLVAVGLAVCAVVLTVDYLGDPPSAPDSSTNRLAQPRSSPSSPPPSLEAEALAVPPSREPDAGAATRVEVEALGIDVPVVPIHLEVSTLVPPSDPQTLGWWADGAAPGDKRGSAIITGHTVHTGGGALDDLETLLPGDEFDVRTVTGRIRYEVSRVEVLDKDRVRRASPRLFSQDVRGRVVLITCEDWDGTGYNSNVVVIAHPR